MSNPFCARCVPPGVWALCGVALVASVIGGSYLFNKKRVDPSPTPPPPVPVQSITIIFHAYDTKGNELKGVLEDDTRRIPTGEGCLVSRKENTHEKLRFLYGKQSQPLDVAWINGDRYKLWLEKGLPETLAAADQTEDKNKIKKVAGDLANRLKPNVVYNKYDFPVIFAQHR